MPQLALSAASFTAAAAPAVAATAAKVGFMTTLKSVAVNLLMNAAITAAMSALQPQVGAAGRPGEWLLSPDGPIPFAAGRVGVAGSAIHIDTFGPDLMYKGFVTVLSGAGPIDGFETFRGDDEFVSFDASGKAISSQWKGEMWLKRSLGAQPDAALTSPVGLKHNATLPGWTGSSRLSGKACDMLILGENSKGSAYPTGEVKPLRVFRGLRVWDPRLDSTYPGGVGPCRLGDPSTWVYSANPGLWAIKWSLGLWEGPVGKGAPQVDRQVGGIGAKASGIEFETLVALANIADANGWTCAAYPTTDDDKSQVLDAFLQAAGAIYAQRAGKISCIQRAAPRTSIVTISVADTAGPLEIDTAASRIDRINTIRPRFWSEPHRWQLTALKEVTAEAYQIEDGGERPRGIDYPYVTNAKQAAQLAALQIAHTREGIAGVIPLKPHLQRIRPGDAFTITEPGFVLNGVKCLCLNTEYDPATGVVRVSFVSETDAKYPFAMGQSPVAPVPPVLTPVDPTYVSPPLPEDWIIVVRPPAPDGTQVPGFDLSGIVSNDTATAIIVEWGLPPDPPPPDPIPEAPEGERQPVWADWVNWTQAYQGPPNVTNIPIEGLQPGQTYYVAIQYQRGQNFSERGVWGPYTAPGLIAGGLSPDSPDWDAIRDVGGTAAAEAEARVQAALDVAKSQLEAADAMTASALLDADTRLTNALNGKASNATVTALKSQADGLSAWRVTAEQVLTDLPNNYASASSVTGLQSEVTAARSGSPTLLARMTADRQVVTDGLAGKASASDLTALTSRMTTAEGVNAAQNTRLNTVETDLAGKASSTALATLSSEVTGARNGSASLGAQLTSMRQTVVDGLAGKAASSDLTNLAATVTNQGTTISGHSTRLTTVESDLAGKASASDLTSLSSVVNLKTRTFRLAEEPPNPAFGLPLVAGDRWINPALNNEERIWAVASQSWVPITDPRIATTASTVAAHASRLTTVETDVAGKASATALSTLSSEVTTARNGSSTLASQLTSMRQTVTDGLAGKASATDVTTLSSRMGTAESSIITAASTAALANGKANAIVGNVLDVNGFISGTRSENDGVRSSFEVLASTFAIRAVGTAARTEFIDGIWYAYDATNSVRSSWGRPHGANGHGLTWWTGPNSVAKGSEVKGNAYVFISMNTVGGPRFGGSDVPSGVVVPKIVSVSAQTAVLTFNSALTDGIWDMSLYALSSPGWVSGAPSGTWAIYEQNVGSAGTAGTLIASGSVRPNGDYEPTTFDFGGGASSAVRVAGDRQLRVIVSGISATSLIFRATYSSATGGGGGGGSGGGGTGPALSDTVPPQITSTGAVGTGVTAARGDHTHAHGNQGGGALHANATTSADGFMAAADKSKLNGVAAGATANSPNATLLDRSNHTGTQAVGTITGLANSATITATGAAWTASTLAQRDNNGDISTRRYLASSTGGAFVIGGSREMGINGAGFGFNVACTGPSFTPTSDIRLKFDFSYVADYDARARLMQVELLEYTRVQDGVRARGFGAQGLREIDPLYVTGDEPVFEPLLGEDNEPLLDAEGQPVMTAVLDEQGEQVRTHLGVDPMALIADLVAAARCHEVAIGALELRHEQALNRIEALEATVAALTAA